MEIITTLNNDAFNFMNSIASPALNVIMNYWAYSFIVVLPAILVWFYIKKDDNLVPYTVAIVLLFVIGEVLKDLFKEPRPCSLSEYSWINQFGCESGYAFPSDHAVTLTGLFIFLKNYQYIRAAYIIWVLVVLFGRIYLGQHYLTDVIAGAAISIIISYAIYKYKSAINKAAYRYFRFILPHNTNGA